MLELKAYSGLIRNYRDLALELDTDISGCSRREREEKLILAAYRRWGTHMGAHINGQFAIAIQDSKTGNIFCTRDPLGAELLFYYRTSDGRLLYGTQIHDLFGQPGFRKELNREMIQFYLAFNYVPGEETLFKGVRKLEPGGYLVFARSWLQMGRYWELAFSPDESKTLDDWARELSQAMDASLGDICDEGEQPDSFLSGGVDSSYILAKSKSRMGYCVAYQDQQVSEEKNASFAAETLGRGFEGVEVSPDALFSNVDDFLTSYEQPSADIAGLSLFCACKKIKEEGRTNLIFSGEGADEFFAGYGVYRNPVKLRLDPDPIYYGCTYIMHPGEQKRFLRDYCENRSTRDFMKERGADGKRYDLTTWMLYVELRSYFEGSILFNSTRIARGTGLDIRMPYCDLRIFDIALRMPSRFKVTPEENKIALRAAASQVLPEEIAYRKKLGFPVPVRSWLADPAYNGDIHRAFESETAQMFFSLDEIGALLDALEGRTPRVSHPCWFKKHKDQLWRYVWTIYTFIRWYELFFVEEEIAA